MQAWCGLDGRLEGDRVLDSFLGEMLRSILEGEPMRIFEGDGTRVTPI